MEMPDANSRGIGVDIELPISDRNQRQRVAAAAAVRKSQQEYRALETYRQAYLVVTTEAPAQVEAATRVRESFERAYELGDHSFLLDAQQAFRETRRLYIEALGTYWRSLYELNAAVGAAIIE